MKAKVSIAVPALALALTAPVLASDAGYIYGRVETVGGTAYEGEIRWGTEEAFWDDIFNASKVGNENLDYVSRRDRERIRWRHLGGLDFLGIGDHDLTHEFAVRFGDLKRLEIHRGENLVAEFRNGETMRLGGGSNDVGATITVVDHNQGIHQVGWNRLRSVQFEETPAKLRAKLGEPLYGTVTSGRGRFTGRIQWDSDETLTCDKLDGDSADGRQHFEFEEIAAIQKERQGSLVTLRSGEQVYLTGTNDVNHSNRGVIVIVPHVGSVKIGWDDFDEVVFRPAPDSGPSYADYGSGRGLNGEVATREGRYDGRLVFDLDETWDFELLNGKAGDTEYLIPFRDIASIQPRGMQRSDVELLNGTKIELDESQDVTRKNDGVLIFEGDREPKYVAWRDVTDIQFTPRSR